MTNFVSVIDLGVNNLRSLTSALEELGLTVLINEHGSTLQGGCPIILPGTGNFSTAVRSLDRRNFREPLIEFANDGIGVLGICLGAQLLLDSSEEGEGKGLGLIAGRSQKLAIAQDEPVPVLGWRRVSYAGNLAGLASDWFYFAHSFKMMPSAKSYIAGSYLRGKESVTAIVESSRNILGCQFHPEKSGPAGLKLLDWMIRTIQT